MKNVVRVLLLLFVAASLVYLVVGRSGSDVTNRSGGDAVPENAVTPTSGGVPTASAGATDARAAPVLVAYYFHGTQRCPTCLKMEQYAKEAIEEAFPDELNGGRVRWQAVNYDEPANEHFVKKYGLVASSLVIVSDRAAAPKAWRRVDRIWDLVGDEQAFKNYVIDEVKNMLGGDS